MGNNNNMKKLADQDEDIARTVAELPPEEARKIAKDFLDQDKEDKK